MLLSQYYYGVKEYDSVLACVDRLDAAIQDPYLDALRTYALIPMRRFDSAHRALDRIMKLDWNSQLPARLLTDLSILEGEHDKAFSIMDTLTSWWGKPMLQGFEADPKHESFITLPAYTEWKKRYLSRHPEE